MTSTAHVSRHVVDLTPGRRAWLNALDLGGPTHSMCGLLEVDVTVPKQLIADEKSRTGEGLSFTGFLISCLARAVDENKEVQAYRKGRKQLVIFDDVNVGMLIDHKNGLMAHVIEGAQGLSRDPPGDPVGPGCTGAAEARHALVVPFRDAASLAAVPTGQAGNAAFDEFSVAPGAFLASLQSPRSSRLPPPFSSSRRVGGRRPLSPTVALLRFAGRSRQHAARGHQPWRRR